MDQPERLAQFLGQGKKLILYHGYGDTAFSPYRTVWFYEDLAAKLGGYGRLRTRFACSWPPGCCTASVATDRTISIRLPRSRNWVEKGKAPNGIVAAQYPDNKPGAAPSRTMPLCAFPAQAHYHGSGEVNDAANWSCPEGDMSQLEVGGDGVAAGMGLGRK